MNGTGAEMMRSTYYDEVFSDFELAVDIARISGSTKAMTSVFVRSPNGDPFENGYVFTINASQGYWVGAFADGALVYWTGWQFAVPISSGIGSTNTLEIVSIGPRMEFSVNGEAITTLTDNRFASGKIGLIAYDNTPVGAVAFDDIVLTTFSDTAPAVYGPFGRPSGIP